MLRIRSSKCDTRVFFFLFFNDTATTEIYTLSRHDALPILLLADGVELRDREDGERVLLAVDGAGRERRLRVGPAHLGRRSEEHTSELQSRQYLVCRLLLETKTKTRNTSTHIIYSTHKSQ